MEQYLLQLPKRLAQEVRAAIGSNDLSKVEMISDTDNKHFKFVVNGKEYGASIAQLPTILETHKTYDDNFLYKSGEIGQVFIVTEKEEERQALAQMEELRNGITPPNTNVTKRKYEKTRRYTPFPKPEVARVEEDLVKIMAPGPYEEVHEELVDFCDWMVDEEHPNGLIVTDELELIRTHPEYLSLSSEASSKSSKLIQPQQQQRIGGGGTSEAESHGGLESAQRSPAFAPTPSSGLSDADDKDVDELEDDLMRGMEEKRSAPPLPVAAAAPLVQAPVPLVKKTSHLDDPAYHQLLASRDRIQKLLRDCDRAISEYAVKVQANANIVMKNRIKQMMDTEQAKRDDIALEWEKLQAQIQEMES